jgi:hypothetical protein
MAGVLNFQQYLGGPDQIKVEQIFPSNQKTLIYTFSNSIVGWTFAADYQTLVIDQIQFNRNTGQPNFANSNVIGSFAKVEVTGGNAPTVISGADGTLRVVLPSGMYAGSIIPDARQNVPITVFSLTWTTNASPAETFSHRWALIQCWEPDVVVGDPTLSAGYTALTLG